LISAGTALFARQGLHRTTTVQIAHEAGVAAGTFYLHFQDKQVLFRQIVDEALARVRARVAAAARRAGSDERARSRARVAELLDFAGEERDLVRVLFGRDGDSAAVGAGVVDALVHAAAKRLASRFAASGITHLHPEVAARALVTMRVQTLVWWIENPGQATRDQVLESLVSMDPVLNALENIR